MSKRCSSDKDKDTKKKRKIEPSLLSKRIHNPIRAVVDTIDISAANPQLELIPLSLGDPTVFGNFKQSQVLTNTLLSNVIKRQSNGYTHSAGAPAARSAVAKRYCTPETTYASSDVVIASGCSGALDLAISVLIDEGTNILVPRPGFPLYETIAVARGGSAKHYVLSPDRGWQADVKQLESLIDKNTRAIVVNNPSNPCGSVFPRSHLEKIVAVARKHDIVIIADEIYANMCFENSTPFTSIASISGNVPVMTVGGLAKEFLVPGWRLGWVLLCDRSGVCEDLRPALQRLTQLVLGACTLIQSVLPQVLNPDGNDSKCQLSSFHDAVNERLTEHAAFTVKSLSSVPGLRVVRPEGAMYVMIGIDPTRFDSNIKDDVTFSNLLLKEEAVFVLPGQCFGINDFFRVVFAAPLPLLKQAYNRISRFCERHHKV